MYQKFEKFSFQFVVCILSVTLFSLSMNSTSMETQAALVYQDDFEDNDYTGWLSDWNYSELNGSWSVVSQNESNMARVQHWGSGSHSLSHDFNYEAGSILSFDMQANGITNYKSHAGGYVTISLFNKFNVALGSVSLQYSTNSGSIDPAYRIDSSLHHYSALMSEWADFAGLTPTDQIEILNLTFTAWGQTTYETRPSGVVARNSTGTVWFDNVNVNTVPEPATLSLLALGCLSFLQRKIYV